VQCACLFCKPMVIVCRVQVYSVDEGTVLRSMTHPVLRRHGYCVEIAATASHWFVTSRNQIHKFVMATGDHVFSVGTTGTTVGHCSDLGGIALYGTELFVADGVRKRVMVFESEGGSFVREFGVEDGQLHDPWKVAVNAAHVFVTDVQRVVVFDRVDGRCVRTVNIVGMNIGAICCSVVCNHTFFAVNCENHVRVFDVTSGTLLHTFGSEVPGPLQFHGAERMVIVGDRLWILDMDNHRIHIVE
jgi:hypothetical protein